MRKLEETVWNLPPSELLLKDNEVHIWMANQQQPSFAVASFWKELSDDERERAKRFRFEKDRRQFVVSRGILRQLLGSYLRVPSESLRFQYSAYGKPSLAEEFSQSQLKFNISHSGEIVLLAFAIRRELGIDIEKIQSELATEEVALGHFSAREILMYLALPERLRTEAFYNCWTRKEAFIKAIGEGVSCALDAFDVSLAPGEPAKLLDSRLEENSIAKWSLVNLDCGSSYKAALIVEKGDWIITCWKWNAQFDEHKMKQAKEL